MTTQTLSELLYDSNYGFKLSKETLEGAIKNNLVVAYGYSDDLLEFRGAIDDELDAWGGTEVLITKNGISEDGVTGESIELIWRDKGHPCWAFNTSIPHKVFPIIEDGELNCIGIIFSLDKLS